MLSNRQAMALVARRRLLNAHKDDLIRRIVSEQAILCELDKDTGAYEYYLHTVTSLNIQINRVYGEIEAINRQLA